MNAQTSIHNESLKKLYHVYQLITHAAQPTRDQMIQCTMKEIGNSVLVDDILHPQIKEIEAKLIEIFKEKNWLQNTILSFHNDPAIKKKYLDRVIAHQKSDRVVQDIIWEKKPDGIYRGTAVGCTLEDWNYDLYPIDLGIPIWVAHLEDRIHTKLPTEEAGEFPEKFLNAIPVGVDVENVFDFIDWHFLESDWSGLANSLINGLRKLK